MWSETMSVGEIKPDINKKSIDFSNLKADTHLTKDEIQIIKEAYNIDKKSLIDATQSNLKDFIIKDYWTANLQILWFNGIIELQNKLWVTPDWSFWPDTFNALMEYQKSNGLKIDGIAGSETIAKIWINIKSNESSKSTKADDKQKEIKAITEIWENTNIEDISKKIDSLVKLIDNEVLSTNNFIKISKNDVKKWNMFDWWEKALKYVATWWDYNKTTTQESYENAIHNSIVTLFKLSGKLKNEINELQKKWWDKNKIDEYILKYNESIGKIKELNNWKSIEWISLWQASWNSTKETWENIINWKSINVLYNYWKWVVEWTLHWIAAMVDPRTYIAIVKWIWMAIWTGLAIWFWWEVSRAQAIEDYKKISQKIADMWEAFITLPPEQMWNAVGKIVWEFAWMWAGWAVLAKSASIAWKSASAFNTAYKWVKVAEKTWTTTEALLAWKKALGLTAKEWIKTEVKLAKKALSKSQKEAASYIKTPKETFNANRRIGQWEKLPKIERDIDIKTRKRVEAEAERMELLDKQSLWENVNINKIEKLEKEINKFQKEIEELNAQKQKIEAIVKSWEFKKWDKVKYITENWKEFEGKIISINWESVTFKPTKWSNFNIKIENFDRFSKVESEIMSTEKSIKLLDKKLEIPEWQEISESISKSISKLKEWQQEFLNKNLSKIDDLYKWVKELWNSPKELFNKMQEFLKSNTFLSLPKELITSIKKSFQEMYRKITRSWKELKEWLSKSTEIKLIWEEIMVWDSLILKTTNSSYKLKKLSNWGFELESTTSARMQNMIWKEFKLFKQEWWNIIMTWADEWTKTIVTTTVRETKILWKSKLENWLKSSESPKSKIEWDIPEPRQQEILKHRENALSRNELSVDSLQKFERELSPNQLKLFENWKMPKPEYKIQADWQEFLLSWIIKSWEREYVMWYVKVEWRYEPRFFYFSQSWWNWHCAPWLNASWRFSKAEFLWASYEKWTIISPEISQHFNSFKNSSFSTNPWKAWLETIGSIDGKQFKSQYWHEFNINKLSWDWESLAHKVSGDKHFKNNASTDDMKNLFRDTPLDQWFDISFNQGFKTWPKQFHEYLWEVDTIIWKTTYNWKEAEVVFAKAKDRPDLIWIENIRYPNSPINSHWIPKDTINWWLLTTKPLEYNSQVPKSVLREAIDYGDYLDIRPYIQENPLIRQFKAKWWMNTVDLAQAA